MLMQNDPIAEAISAFGSRAAGLRKQRELSQENLAARMKDRGHKWHQTTVAKVENGTRDVSFREAYDLARCLDVHLRDFMAGESGGVEDWSHRLELAQARQAEATAAYQEAKQLFERALDRMKTAEVAVINLMLHQPRGKRTRKGQD